MPVHAAPVLTPKASILVDADTGNVLDGLNVHEALPPASLSKIFTALTSVYALPPDTAVPVSARTAGMPAHNMNMKEGQVWRLEDVLSSLLVSSANDAGMALAERVSGSAEAFAGALASTADRLGLSDHPILQDPSGLDDNFSIGGGNRVSARDMAIAARALLAEPRLAPIVASKTVSFTGGDNIAHRLVNHNRLLWTYQGAIGMKTGYTKRSLHSLVGVASRNGRTMIAVILDSPGDTYGPTGALLDKGFATAVGAEPAAGRLPALPGERTAGVGGEQKGSTQELAAPTGDARQLVAAGPVSASGKHGHGLLSTVFWFLVKLLLVTAVAAAILRIRVVSKTTTRTIDVRDRERIPEPKPRPVPAKRLPPAPRPARPITVERARPQQSRPAVPKLRPLRARSRVNEVGPQVDPRLATRFELLVRTGEVPRD